MEMIKPKTRNQEWQTTVQHIYGSVIFCFVHARLAHARIDVTLLLSFGADSMRPHLNELH